MRPKLFQIKPKKSLKDPLNLPLRIVRQHLKVTEGASKPLNKMQLPTIDRNPNVRPAGADLASSGASRVIPVAPVNPAVHASPKLEAAPAAQPGVIDMVNPALKTTTESERAQIPTPDPIAKTSMADAVPKDWTIHHAPQQKTENPPPKPISQILMDHLKTMWTASASAIQVEQVANTLNTPTPTTPTQAPGELAKQAVIYAPSKVKKNENI